jgi:predicted GNAT family N-acyltransferase
MAIATTEQARGIGRQMLYFAEGVAKEKGFTVLMMHARDKVLPFYLKCGYSINGMPFSEVGIPHHKMQKDLQVANKG